MATTWASPNPGSFFALQLDEHGSGVEVYPAGTELQPGGANGGSFVKKEARGYGPTHFALSVATDADKVEAIAAREGWQCFRCNRGPFHVIEVWSRTSRWSKSYRPSSRANIWRLPVRTRSRRQWRPPHRQRHVTIWRSLPPPRAWLAGSIVSRTIPGRETVGSHPSGSRHWCGCRETPRTDAERLAPLAAAQIGGRHRAD
jgi:hypothetical protein